jgi:soluble lytic murein transglycosylase
MRRRSSHSRGILITIFLGLALGVGLYWGLRDYVRSSAAIYADAQRAGPARAMRLYDRLGKMLPQIEEYAQVWSAELAMPDLEAMRTLQSVADFRPQSPAAFEAHVTLARYYASIGAPAAEDAYRAALALDDTVALRLELAHLLEARGERAGAYGEYHTILGRQPDAFAGMRRLGQDVLGMARDLIRASYYSDALEALRGVDDPAAVPLRAEALSGLWRNDEALDAYQAWLAASPDDEAAKLGLAGILRRLGRLDEALTLYQTLESADSQLAQAEMMEEERPQEALALYADSPYPVAWWSATTLLEASGRLTETVPFYTRLAQSSTYLADDAAYRLLVLARRLGDADAAQTAHERLEDMGQNWLAWRATGEPFALDLAPAPGADAGDLLEKVAALDSIGREDLAHRELILGARFRDEPEVDLALARALAARGKERDAQYIAEPYTAGDRPASRSFWELSYPRPYLAAVEMAAAEFGVDPLLLWAIMREESRFDPEAISYVGARGLMQVMPSTQEWIAERLGEEIAPADAFTPEANIRMGAWFLRFALDYFDQDEELAIAAYNGGATSVDIWLDDPLVDDRDDLLRWIGYGETREYLSRVSLSYLIYRELYAGAQ